MRCPPLRSKRPPNTSLGWSELGLKMRSLILWRFRLRPSIACWPKLPGKIRPNRQDSQPGAKAPSFGAFSCFDTKSMKYLVLLGDMVDTVRKPASAWTADPPNGRSKRLSKANFGHLKTKTPKRGSAVEGCRS